MSQWSKAKLHFKKHPASHLTSFIILHEATALLPIPIVYYGLKSLNTQIPFPPDLVDLANDKVSKLLSFFNIPVIDPMVMLHWTSAYLIVKALMPLRIGLCTYSSNHRCIFCSIVL